MYHVCTCTYLYKSNSHFISGTITLAAITSDACPTLCGQNPAYPKSPRLSGRPSKACHVQTSTATCWPHRRCCHACHLPLLRLHIQPGNMNTCSCCTCEGLLESRCHPESRALGGFCPPCSQREPRRDMVLEACVSVSDMANRGVGWWTKSILLGFRRLMSKHSLSIHYPSNCEHKPVHYQTIRVHTKYILACTCLYLFVLSTY